MNRYPKYVPIIFCAVTALLLGLMAYITVILDTNAYKARIVQLVESRTQRNIKLEGDVQLSFFPRIAVRTGRLTLSEYRSGESFAAAENIRVSLELLPLLRKQLVLDEIVVVGLTASLVRFQDGRTNIDDLIAEREEQQFELDIGRIRMEKATISLSDEASGAHFLLRDFDLKVDGMGAPSRSGNRVVENKVKLDFRLDEPGEPETEVAARLAFDLAINKDDRRYALKHLALTAEARSPAIPLLVIHSTGNFSARPANDGEADEFVADGVIVDISFAGDEEDKTRISLQMPRLSLRGEKLSGDGMDAMAKFTRPDGLTAVRLSLSALRGTINSFASDALTAELESRNDAFTINGTIASPLAGSIAARQMRLPEIKSAIHIAHSDAPDRVMEGKLAGDASVDGFSRNENARVNLGGKLDGSDMVAKLSATVGAAPWLTFAVTLDRLDLDRLRPASQALQSGPDYPDGTLSSGDLSLLNTLEDLNVRGSIRIGMLKAAGVRSSGVKLDIRPD